MTDLAKGMEAFNNKDYKTALEILHPLAEEGNDAKAQYIIGYMCEMGLSIPQNYSNARGWYERAYKNGEVMAQFRIGLSYYQGLLGVEINHAAAKKVFANVAIKGLPEGQYYLALMYERGEGGVDANLVEAHTWYNLAASKGYEDSAIARDRVAQNMTPKEIIDAQDSALLIFKNPPKS